MPITKEPLTPAGIASKLADLYALSDSLLRAEAVLIRDDFRNWMDDNFTMTTDQEGYLDGFPADYEEFLADMLYVAVKNRRPVVYTPPDTTARASKLLPISDTFEWEYNPDVETFLSGALDITATTA